VTDIVIGMTVSTRRALPGDAAELHSLAARTFALACPPGTLQADIDAFVAAHLSEAKFEDYLKDDNRILLIASASAEPTSAEPTAVGLTSAQPTSAEPTSFEPTSSEPTSAEPTSFEPTSAEAPPEDRASGVVGAPAGYSMLVSGPIADPDVRALVPSAGSIELSKFYVLPDKHGSGLAAELMKATIAAAVATGATSCWLGVNQQNVRAARFYSKSGFEVIGTKRFKVGNEWHDDHVRLRPLVD
jgi:ribosomal protein S18 acetylase RimI-like enzyme